MRTGLRGLASEPPTVEPDPGNAGAGRSQRPNPTPCEHGGDTHARCARGRRRGHRPRHRLALRAARTRGHCGRPGARVAEPGTPQPACSPRSPSCTTASRPCSGSISTRSTGSRSSPPNSPPPASAKSATAESGALVAAWDDADLASLRDLQSFGCVARPGDRAAHRPGSPRTGTRARVGRRGWPARPERSRRSTTGGCTPPCWRREPIRRRTAARASCRLEISAERVIGVRTDQDRAIGGRHRGARRRRLVGPSSPTQPESACRRSGR